MWWAGDRRVEPYMARVREALDRHAENLSQQASTDIYNRAYEAVYSAIKDYDKHPIRNVLSGGEK